MMAPPTPPPYGTGPANFANPSGNEGPFSPFDNTINYQNMARYQMVTQYNQYQPIPSFSYPLAQQRKMLLDSRYSYGDTYGIYDTAAYYNRNAALQRTAYSAAIGSSAANWMAWGAASAGTAAAGIGGITGFFAPLILTSPLSSIITKRAQETLDRQKYMQSIALDLQINRERLGMRGITYNEASSAGMVISNWMMSEKGRFFNPEQMLRIQKIGIASGLLTAGGRNAGTIQQYVQNVKDLISATEDIVKTLQTTADGALSLMKELNNTGFTSLNQIKQQVKMAKAIGGMTGIGTQNAFQLGAAGAQAVQGTPWNAAVGASMFQMGGVAARAISASSAQGAYAVERAGGIAQAGAIIAGTQMNILQSAIGTRMAAYIMNPNGTLNQNRLSELLAGKPTAYQVVSGANATGFAMGQDRVRFEMFKGDLWNQLSDTERISLTRQAFRLWGQGRYGSLENKAWVFAGQYTNDLNSRRIFYESLIGPSGAGFLAAESYYNQLMEVERARSGPIGAQWPRLQRFWREGIRRPVELMTDQFIDFADILGRGVSKVAAGIAWDLGPGLVNIAATSLGIDPYGIYERRRPYTKDMETTYKRLLGLSTTGDISRGIMAMRSLGSEGIPRITPINIRGFGDERWESIVRKTDPKILNDILARLTTSLATGTAASEMESIAVKRFLQTDLRDWGYRRSQMPGLAAGIVESITGTLQSMSKKYENATGEYKNWYRTLSVEKQNGVESQLNQLRVMISRNNGLFETPIENQKTGMMLVKAGSEIMNVPIAVGRLAVAESDYYRRVNSVKGLKSDLIDYAGIEKSIQTNITNVIRNYIPQYVSEKIRGAAGAGKTSLALSSLSAINAEYNLNTSIEQKRNEFEAASLAVRADRAQGIISRSNIKNMRRAGWRYNIARISKWVLGKSPIKAFAQDEFGVDISTPAGALELASQMEEAYRIAEAGGALGEMTPRQMNLTKLGDTMMRPPGAMKEISIRQYFQQNFNERARADVEMAVTGLINQAQVLGFKTDREAWINLLSDPENKQYLSKLMPAIKEMTGQTEDVIYSWQKSGGKLISNILNKIVPEKVYSSSKIIQLINEEKKRLLADKNAKMKEDVAALVGGNVNMSGEKAIKILNDALQNETAKNIALMTEMMVSGMSGKGGNTTSVGSPIMNYWNNRWIL